MIFLLLILMMFIEVFSAHKYELEITIDAKIIISNNKLDILLNGEHLLKIHMMILLIQSVCFKRSMECETFEY